MDPSIPRGPRRPSVWISWAPPATGRRNRTSQGMRTKTRPKTSRARRWRSGRPAPLAPCPPTQGASGALDSLDRALLGPSRREHPPILTLFVRTHSCVLPRHAGE
eukprot:125171-Pyramimonas_sp.AAC.1